MTTGYVTTYAIYITNNNVSYSNTTSDNPTATIIPPNILSRCNNTAYMSEASAAAIDQHNTKLKLVCDLYRTKTGGTYRSMYAECIDLFNGDLS